MQMTRRNFATSLGLVAVGGLTMVTRALAGQTDSHTAHATPEALWQDLLQGNQRFVKGESRSQAVVKVRQELAKGQQPKVVVLGCADSRLSPELIFDKSLGDLFVVRTAGNIADPIALGSLEYAVEHLHASLLVVLGHEKCGAVAAAASGEKMPSANLQAIVDKISPAIEQIKGQAVNSEHLVSLGVEANIHQCARELSLRSAILQQEVTAGKLTIVKAMYRLYSGEVVHLG